MSVIKAKIAVSLKKVMQIKDKKPDAKPLNLFSVEDRIENKLSGNCLMKNPFGLTLSHYLVLSQNELYIFREKGDTKP